MELKETLHKCKRKLQKIIDYYLPDRIYLKKKYKEKMGKELNLNNPQTYTEKINWLKLYDRRPEYTAMVDKYSARDYVKHRIEMEGYNCSELGLNFIPLLGVWDSVDDIDYDSLPNQFVLKCTHDSESVIICKEKTTFDFEDAKKKLSLRLKRNAYKPGREWVYKNVTPRIVAEQYMYDTNHPSLIDYKFFCFNGKAKVMFLATDRPYDTRFDFYDMQFNHLSIINGHPNSEKQLMKPLQFEKMISLAEILSQGIPHVRIDFYEINGNVYFGEMTFYHHGGLTPFEPEEWDLIFGNWLDLPRKRCY